MSESKKNVREVADKFHKEVKQVIDDDIVVFVAVFSRSDRDSIITLGKGCPACCVEALFTEYEKGAFSHVKPDKTDTLKMRVN